MKMKKNESTFVACKSSPSPMDDPRYSKQLLCAVCGLPLEMCACELSDMMREKKHKRIYIACPYSAGMDKEVLHNVPRAVQRNVDRAIAKFHELKSLGYYPFVPTLSHYLHIHPSCPENYGEWYYEFDNTFITDWAEVIYMCKGWKESKGCKAELALAKKLGLEVIYEEE